jgi:hypothetical protein
MKLCKWIWLPLKSGIAQGDKETKETPEEIILLCLVPERNTLMLSSEVEVSRFWVVEMGYRKVLKVSVAQLFSEVLLLCAA